MNLQHSARPAAGIALIAVALGAGVAIAKVDASPGWDSTGITALALALAAGGSAFVARDRPWLWALLIGLPTPAVEILDGGPVASVLAVLFAVAGAGLGWALARAR